ncbi:MAG: hypothetical protein PHG69_01090 [Candidatus Omnitrophica bacterium]|nr:hypothetical protein [Candidatus Omnitrophota bacterium]
MKKRLITALLLMGFTSLVVQVLLIREFLICFYGNELTIGLILGNWIILEALGSGLASKFSRITKKPLFYYCLLQCLIAIYLPCAVYLIRTIRNFLPLSSGEAVGIIPVFVSSLLILAPLSIFDGAQFPVGCRLWKDYSKKGVESVGTVYIFEAIGFIIAGPVFTFIFITKLQSFQIAFIIGLLNLFSAILLLQKESKFIFKKLFMFVIIALVGVSAISLYPEISHKINILSLKKQWQGLQLADYKNSIYGNIAVTKEKEQYTFFTDGIPIITTPVPDITATEEFIHFGMLSHKNPRDILIVGGGAGGAIYEILRYPINHLDYAELDPLLINMIKKYTTPLTKKEFQDKRLSVKITDAALYVKNTEKTYDIIFIKLPLPTTLQLNRFYTKEFFDSAKNILKNDGIIVFNLTGSLSYLNTQLQKLNLSIMNTLKDVFPFVKVIPGESNVYLASVNNFSATAPVFIQRLKERSISTHLLTSFYIQDRLDRRWSDWFFDTLSKTKSVKDNSAFLPMGLFYSLSYWDALFSPQVSGFFKLIEKINLNFLVLFVFAISILLIFLSNNYRFRKISIQYSILTTGLLGMSYELLIIFLYQSFYGYIYHHIALLITSFMLGLTLGGWIFTRARLEQKNTKAIFISFETGLIIFSLAILPLFMYLEKTRMNLSFVFFILSIISGFLVGSEFPLANRLYKSQNLTQTAGILYALDLVGSWIGALIVSVALIPVIGIIQTCIFLAAVKLSSIILISRFKN